MNSSHHTSTHAQGDNPLCACTGPASQAQGIRNGNVDIALAPALGSYHGLEANNTMKTSPREGLHGAQNRNRCNESLRLNGALRAVNGR